MAFEPPSDGRPFSVHSQEWAILEGRTAQKRRCAYLDRNRFSFHTNDPTNVLAVLQQGSAIPHPAPHEFSRVLQILQRDTGSSWAGRSWTVGLFERGEVLGRAGWPLRVVGYPYLITKDDLRLVKEIEALGLDVQIKSPSIRGFFSFQVEVYARQNRLYAFHESECRR